MLEILVALIVIGVIYYVCNLLLPAPIPVLVALVLVLVFVLIPLLHTHVR